jgi:pimeloyl-ACP methyl ester carboxylesterase
MLSPELEAWRSQGKYARVFGHDVFHVNTGPVAPGDQKTAIVVLHGYPTSSIDFRQALPRLAKKRQVVVHDHLGFGLSSKPDRYGYTLIDQAEIAIGLWRELGIRRAHLVAHDYGTSVATEIIARRERGLLPIELASLTLCNGSMHIELSRLKLTQKLLKNPLLGPVLAQLSSKRLFTSQLRSVFANPGSISDAELDLHWEALTYNEGKERLAEVSRYQEDRWRFWHRWIGALTRLDLPTHVLWGRRDPVAVAAIADQLAVEIPGARLTWLEELGHYPMIEDAKRWSEAVLSELGE